MRCEVSAANIYEDVLTSKADTMLRSMWLALAGFLAIAAHAQVVHYADLDRVAQRPDVQAFETRLAAAAASRDYATFLELARSTQGDAMPDMVRQHLRVALANHMAGLSLTPALMQWLRTMASEPVTIRVAHEHDGHSTAVPAWDPGAAARHALAKQAERESAAALQASIASGRGIRRALGNAAEGKAQAPLNASVYADAVRGLDRAVLAREIDGLTAQLSQQPELGAAMIEAARLLERPELLIHVAKYGRARDVRLALTAAKTFDDTFDALPMIRAATARPDTAASGLNALARAAIVDPGLTTELLEYLRRPDTARAAAAAIAAHADPALVAYFARELDTTRDADYGAALALTLSLMPQPQARAALLEWSAQDGTLMGLRIKIRQAYREVRP